MDKLNSFDFNTFEKKKKIKGNINKNEDDNLFFIRKQKNIYRKAFGVEKLFQALPTEFHEDDCIHCLSNGDIDSLAYLQYLLKFQDLKYCLFSTWCLAMDDILTMKEFLEKGKIKKLDAYVGEIFPKSYYNEYEELSKLLKKYSGRIGVFRNHSKIFVGIGEKFNFIIESSANINTNPRAENTVITISKEGAFFYKEYFDGIKSFNRDFDDWKKEEL